MSLDSFLSPNDEFVPVVFSDAAKRCASLGLPTFEVKLPTDFPGHIAIIRSIGKSATINLCMQNEAIIEAIASAVRYLSKKSNPSLDGKRTPPLFTQTAHCDQCKSSVTFNGINGQREVNARAEAFAGGELLHLHAPECQARKAS